MSNIRRVRKRRSKRRKFKKKEYVREVDSNNSSDSVLVDSRLETIELARVSPVCRNEDFLRIFCPRDKLRVLRSRLNRDSQRDIGFSSLDVDNWLGVITSNNLEEILSQNGLSVYSIMNIFLWRLVAFSPNILSHRDYFNFDAKRHDYLVDYRVKINTVALELICQYLLIFFRNNGMEVNFDGRSCVDILYDIDVNIFLFYLRKIFFGSNTKRINSRLYVYGDEIRLFSSIFIVYFFYLIFLHKEVENKKRKKEDSRNIIFFREDVAKKYNLLGIYLSCAFRSFLNLNKKLSKEFPDSQVIVRLTIHSLIRLIERCIFSDFDQFMYYLFRDDLLGYFEDRILNDALFKRFSEVDDSYLREVKKIDKKIGNILLIPGFGFFILRKANDFEYFALTFYHDCEVS